MTSILEQSSVYNRISVKSKINDLCGDKILKDMMMADVERTATQVLSEISTPPSKKAINHAWSQSKRTDSLSDFIFKVWRNDK